jgi:hypothetical protein
MMRWPDGMQEIDSSLRDRSSQSAIRLILMAASR